MANLGEVQKWAARVDTLTQRISDIEAEADSQAVYIRKLQNENGEYLQGKKQAEKKVLELEEELSMIYSQQARVAELEADACKFYKADGSFEILESPEAVTAKRKEFAVKVAELEAEREWISVDDRLPDENEPVLIAYNCHVCGVSQGIAIMHKLSRHVGKDSPIDTRWFFSPGFGHEVKPTDWKHLPSPSTVRGSDLTLTQCE
jgi:hypothetical protein